MVQATPAQPPASLGSATNADILALLTRIDARLDRVERAVERAESLSTAAPAAVATAVDTFDALAARAQEGGVDLDARLAGALRLVERLTDPRVERSLARLLDAAPLLERMMEMAEQAPGLLAALVDTADSLQDRMREAGVDIDARGHTVIRVIERLTAPEALRAVETLLGRVDAIEAVLGSGVLDPRALAAVATAGDALAKAANAPPSRVGLWGAMRAVKDPEVQTALAFVIRFAHAFGADLHEPPTERRLVAGAVR